MLVIREERTRWLKTEIIGKATYSVLRLGGLLGLQVWITRLLPIITLPETNKHLKWVLQQTLCLCELAGDSMG